MHSMWHTSECDFSSLVPWLESCCCLLHGESRNWFLIHGVFETLNSFVSFSFLCSCSWYVLCSSVYLAAITSYCIAEQIILMPKLWMILEDTSCKYFVSVPFFRPALGGLLSSSYRQHQESLAAERERRRVEREERLQRIEREERNKHRWGILNLRLMILILNIFESVKKKDFLAALIMDLCDFVVFVLTEMQEPELVWKVYSVY